MTTRAATMASAISNRMRQIRDRSHPATRDTQRHPCHEPDLHHRPRSSTWTSQSFTAKFTDRVVARRRTWRARRPPRPRQDRRSGARTPLTSPLADPALRLQPLRRHAGNLRQSYVRMRPNLKPIRAVPDNQATSRR